MNYPQINTGSCTLKTNLFNLRTGTRYFTNLETYHKAPSSTTCCFFTTTLQKINKNSKTHYLLLLVTTCYYLLLLVTTCYYLLLLVTKFLEHYFLLHHYYDITFFKCQVSNIKLKLNYF